MAEICLVWPLSCDIAAVGYASAVGYAVTGSMQILPVPSPSGEKATVEWKIEVTSLLQEGKVTGRTKVKLPCRADVLHHVLPLALIKQSDAKKVVWNSNIIQQNLELDASGFCF